MTKSTEDTLLEAVDTYNDAENIRSNSHTALYFEIKELRNQAKHNEQESLLEDPRQKPPMRNWLKLETLLTNTLAELTHDIELASWLIEAKARTGQFLGLAESFQFTHELINNHWVTLHPQDEDEDTRIIPFIGLNGKTSDGVLVAPILCLPLLEDHNFSTWDYMQALQLRDMKDQEAINAKIAAGVATLDQLEVAAKNTSPELLINKQLEIEQALDAYDVLVNSLETAYGEHIPSSNISNAFKSCLEAMRFFTKHVQSTVEASLDNETIDAPSDESTSSFGSFAGNSSEEAFILIQKIADYFRQTQPHSPVSYLLEQCVRWGRMPLPELLQELITEPNALRDYCKLTGVTAEQSPALGPAVGATSTPQELPYPDPNFGAPHSPGVDSFGGMGSGEAFPDMNMPPLFDK